MSTFVKSTPAAVTVPHGPLAVGTAFQVATAVLISGRMFVAPLSIGSVRQCYESTRVPIWTPRCS
jgi:hypothetical protein